MKDRKKEKKEEGEGKNEREEEKKSKRQIIKELVRKSWSTYKINYARTKNVY